jgi:hypothetical protein
VGSGQFVRNPLQALPVARDKGDFGAAGAELSHQG